MLHRRYFKTSSQEAEFKKEIENQKWSPSKSISLGNVPKKVSKSKPAEVVNTLNNSKENESNHLDVVMLGKSLLEQKKKEIDKVKTDVNKLADVEIVQSNPNYAPETSMVKPAIIPHANTTKPVILEHRKPIIRKKVDVPKLFKKIQKQANENRTELPATPLHSHTSIETKQHCWLDVGKSLNDRLKSFARMDVEFYKIINEMNLNNSLRKDEAHHMNQDSERSYTETTFTYTQNVDNSPNVFTRESFEIKSEENLMLSPVQLSTNISDYVHLKNYSKAEEIETPKSDCAVSGGGKDLLVRARSKMLGSRLNSTTIFAAKVRCVNEETLKGNSTLSVNPIADIANAEVAMTSSSCKCNHQNTMEVAMVNEDVCYEDIVNVSASKASFNDKPVINPVNSEIYVSKQSLHLTSGPARRFEEHSLKSTTENPKTVHQFCTIHSDKKLSDDLNTQSLFSHTPAKYDVLKQNKEQAMMFGDKVILNSLPSYQNPLPSFQLDMSNFETEDMQSNVDDERLSKIAEKILKDIESKSDDNGNDSMSDGKDFLKLQQIVNQMFDESQEFDAGVVGKKVHLKLDNSRYFNAPGPPKLHMKPVEVSKSLAPEYISFLADIEQVETSDSDIEDDLIHTLQDNEVVEKIIKAEEDYRRRIISRRHNSVPEFSRIDTDSEDYDSEDGNEETGLVEKFESVIDMRRRQNKSRPETASSFSVHSMKDNLERRCQSQPNFIVRKMTERPLFLCDYDSVMKETRDLSQQLQTMRVETDEKDEQSVPVPELIEPSDEKVNKQEILTANISNLERAMSWPQMDVVQQHDERLTKYSSDSALDTCEALFENQHKIQSQADLIAVLKEKYWYKWMDELYALDFPQDNYSDDHSVRTDSQSTHDSMQDIETVPVQDLNITKVLKEEIATLTSKIEDVDATSGILGFHLCRRGACYRKAGEIKKALTDLDRAIQLEPRLVDAYWHRHLVFRIHGNTKNALDDLNHITKIKHNHLNALRSRGEIYKEKGNIELAIYSFSEAIRVNPTNTELLYERAELLKQKGDIMLALEDYKSVNNYQPNNTTALHKIGTYHFEIGSWMIAVNDFTELLSKEPKNAKAYFYRGRANSKLLHYGEAIADISISIHLQPDNYMAFYHRGCLLRKFLPHQALQDFSVSLLLNSSVGNVSSYLHRGILYTELQRYEQASLDFEAAVRLNCRLAPAHVNLGVIEMLHNQSMRAAIRRFNVAIRMDPTYIRAYICRADAYERCHNINAAILDYSRVIHMKPDNTDFRIARFGTLAVFNTLLEELDTWQCAVMGTGTTSSSIQLAVVQTFLKNFDEAIHILEVTLKNNPLTHLHVLLGKTKMKALRYQEAIERFQQVLEIMKPWNPKHSWPKEASDVYYMIGICHMEQKLYSMALNAFNHCLKINPNFAEACYQRGVAKLKSGLSKGVYNFNRALACRPNFYQAFLARALYYGMNKRYSKAIMNCNEAVKLEGRSVQAYLYRGAIKCNIKAYGLAIKDLSKAISNDRSCVLAYFNRAVCYQQKKYYFKALKDYSVVLMCDESLKFKALLNRGLLYFQIGDMENARQDFLMALMDTPNNAKIYHALALCYHRMGHLEKALETFTASLQCDPFFWNALIGRGNVYMDFNSKSGIVLGRRDYSRALHMNPSCVEARVNLAYCLQLSNRYMKSWNLLTRTIEIDPVYRPALESRALVNLRMLNTYGAFLDINNAIKIGKSAELLNARGVINQQLGDNVNAMKDYQMSRKINPSYAHAYYNAGNLYFLHKQFDQAMTYYSKSIDWDPTNVSAYVNRAVTKCVMKDKSSLQDFEAAVSLAPHWSHIYFNRGNVYFALQMYENAEQDFSKAISLKPNDALLFKRRADTRGKLGQKQAALKDYRRSIDLKSI